MKPDKVIVTNMGALKEKYAEGFGWVQTAIERLIAADKKRELDTKLVAIDSASDMSAVHGEVVKEKEDQRAVKRAVDAVFDAYEPDYIMILGAQDIVPHQDLKNPAYDPGGDDDKVVPSDIPYACEAPYSKEPGDFVGPRVFWEDFLIWSDRAVRPTLFLFSEQRLGTRRAPDLNTRNISA